VEIHELLDCGCGTAPLAGSILAMGARYTGIDFSPKMIDAARKNVARFTEKDNVRLQAGDITALEFPSQSFDAVVAMGVLEYLNVEQIRQALTQIRSVLKPRGIAILTVPKNIVGGKQSTKSSLQSAESSAGGPTQRQPDYRSARNFSACI
jgi:ubiquinone/menaquinone biosynthesis C-methylase UbiE